MYPTCPFAKLITIILFSGFSFANNSYYVQYTDDAAIHMYEALLQFFQLFPEYKETPLFIIGESYAGMRINKEKL